jgi:uncharacterized repeat protein (TIGR03809 family)
MTERTDVARGRDIVVRWSALAEQRLDYLTELYETGRWRRYYSEGDFLENIREAKGAVETWHGLLTAEATPDNRPIDFSWIGRSSAALLPRVNVPSGKREVPVEPIAVIAPVAPQLAELPVAPSVSVVPAMAEPEPPITVEPIAVEPVAVLEATETLEQSTLVAIAAIEDRPLETTERLAESNLDKTLALTLDIVGMAERYPLLRNAFQQAGNG